MKFRIQSEDESLQKFGYGGFITMHKRADGKADAMKDGKLFRYCLTNLVDVLKFKTSIGLRSCGYYSSRPDNIGRITKGLP